MQSAIITNMSIISNCTASVIKKAAASLVGGNLVAFPTETVYGLGADATNIDAVSRIYEVKGRPKGHPLIIHIASVENLDIWARDIPEYAIKLARNFWPGPMTLILPRTSLAKDFITGAQDNVGIRIPSQLVALELLREFESQGGLGIAAPSANRFGAVSPTTASAVESELGDFLNKKDLILNGGTCEIGVESTIINCTQNSPSILRPGAITSELIEKNLGFNLNLKNSYNDPIKSSGSHDSHYSPKAKVYLNGSPKSGDGFIAYSHIETPKGAIRLASPKNNEEFAQVLYAALRLGDTKGVSAIHVIPPNKIGIGLAILDRLKKSSSLVEISLLR